MKKIMKTSLITLSALLVLGACSLFPEGTVIGTLDGQDLRIKYFDEVFPDGKVPGEDTTNNNTTDNNTTTQNNQQDKEEPPFNASSVVMMNILGPVLAKAGNAKVDRQQLNTTISRLKGQYGDKYLEESEKRYSLPIKTEQDLINVLSFSLLYNDYFDRLINVTDEQISQAYNDKYKTKYCASHILVETEEGANNLLGQINNGTKKFEDYEAEAEAIMKEQTPQSQKLQLKDADISGVKVKEIADLDCKPASTYVAEFAAALKNMQPGQTTATPVKTQFGYHIIKLRSTEENAYDKAIQDEIKNDLLNEKKSAPGFSAHYIKELLSKVNLEITSEPVKKVWDDYIKKEDEEAVKFKPETANQEQPEGEAPKEEQTA